MRAVSTRFTRADYNRLPEGFPAQLVRGVLVKEAARNYGHQVFLGRLHTALSALVGPERAIPAPSDVGIDEWNVYQPDVLVLRTPPSFEVPIAFRLLVGFTSIWNSFWLLPSKMPLLMRTSGP